MGNTFDGLAKMMFDSVTAIMGETATWSPSIGGPEQTAKVLVKAPTEESKIAIGDYDIDQYFMEYLKGYFPGLQESANQRTNKERVTINGILYGIVEVKPHYDGKTLKAQLTKI